MTTNPILRFCPVLPLFALLPLALRAVQVEFRMAPYDDPAVTVEERSWDRPKYAPVNTAHGVELQVVGRDYACWARNVKLDGRPVFERYHGDRYVDRAPRARADVAPGEHVLWPGNHVFSVAEDGALSTEDPSLRVEEGVVTILAWPVAIKSLLANAVDPALPEAMRMASIPNLAVRDSSEQEKDEAALAAWEASGGEGPRPGSSASELLPAFGDFAPLVIWLPANTEGNGYRLHPIGQSFTLDADGVHASFVGDEPPVPGLDIAGFTVSIPLYRFPVHGDPGTRLVVSGVEAYDFTDRRPDSGTRWYPRRRPYEVLAGQEAQPIRIDGDLLAAPFKALAVYNTTTADGSQCVAMVEHAGRHFRPGSTARFRVQAASGGGTNTLSDAVWRVACREFGSSVETDLPAAASPGDGAGVGLEVAIPDSLPDGVYEFLFRALPSEGGAPQAEVATRATVARPADFAAGVFTPRGRTAFYRGEDFWLGLGALSTDPDRPLPAGQPLALELVDPRGNVHPLFSEPLPADVGARATRIVRVDAQRSFDFAAGRYVLRPALGPAAGRERTIDIVDPEPESHFTTLQTGKYNSQGTEYANLLRSGDRAFAEDVVREMREAGVNAFMGMTYDFDRVVFPDADVEQLVRERPELGPWECWFQPSGRDRFLDACVRHNLRFWENLFTYNDTSLPRGARIRAGSARFAGLETHSLRYSPAFQGVCLYDEIYSRSGDDGLHVGNDFDTSTEMEYREAYPGRTGAQAAKALERFASRPAAQRSADDLDYARSWVAWEDEMWTRWCHAIVRPVREVAPFSRNFVLNRYWGGNGGNIAANGYEKGIFDELDIAACVMYKDGGYGDRPVFAPMQADVLRVRPGMPVWTQIHDFNGPGVNGRHLLRQAFLALGQKVDGFTFFCTSFPTDDPAQHDHQWNVANIARELCLPYGDFFLSLDKGYRKVAVYYSRTAAFMGARKANSLGHQCELLWVACLRAGFPADYIRDEDLLEGRADGYEAIFVPGFTYEEECPEALLKELRRLVSAGVVVLVEKSSKLPLEGAVRLQSDLDEYEDRLGGAFPRYIDYETEVVFRRSDETTKLLGEVLPRHVEPAAMHDLPFGPDWQTRGQGHYLFAANYSPVGFRGLSMTLYQAPRIASMAFPPRGPVCYDLLEMRRIDAPVRDDGLQHVDVDMRRSPGKILAFLPEPVGGVLLRAPATLSVGGNLPCTVSVAGESGAPIDASFPVELTLVDPEGKRPYHVFRAAAPELRASWRLPANVPAGNWTLEARELLSGKTARATIEVKAASRAAPDAPAEKGCRVEDEDRIRAFLGEIRETEAVIPVEPDRPDLHAAATAFARRLAAKGCRARVEIVTDVVRPPVPLDPRNPQLDGTRLWRGTPVNPAQFLDAPCIVFGGRRDNRLLATLAARAVFDQSPSEAFPGPGRGFLAWVRGAFSIGYDTLVVSGADPEALDQAVDALLAFEPADVPARPPVAEAYAKGVGSDTVRPPEPIDIPAMAGRIDLSPPAAPADSAIAPAPAAEPRPENRTEAFLGDDMVMALDVDPATGRALVGTYGYGTNLFCIAADGTVEWSAFLPEFDVYRASWCDGGRRVAALTGRGWYVFVLDGATGGILARSSATEWPDTHWTEGCVDTHVALADNRPARQLLVCGRTGLLAMDYDGRPLWFHDLAGEIATYPEEAEKSGAAAIFPRNARVGSAVASPDGTRIALSYYRNIGTTMDQTKQVDLWGFRPCVLDAATGQRLCISTNDPGMEMSPSGWTITWPEGSGNPLVWYHGFARQGQPIAAELLPDGQLGDWLPRASHNQTVEAALDRLPREVARTGADGGTAWRTATRYAIPRLDALSADGSRLYRSGRDGFVQCIDLANGAIPWSTPVGASARLVPLADGGVLAGTLQGRVVRLGGDGATAWTLDLRRLQELPGRDYPDVVRDAVVRDALKHHVPFPSRPERPGDLDGILRFGVEHATNGSFEEDGAWEPAPADGVEPDGGGDAPVLSAPACDGARSLFLSDGRLVTQDIDRRLIPVGTYLLEFRARFDDTRTRLAAGAILGDADGAERYAISSFSGIPGEWTFGRVAIKTTARAATMQIGFEADGGPVRVDAVSLRPVRFPSGNLLANEPLHNVEPTFVRDIRVRYNRVPPALKQSILQKSRVTAYRQGPTDTGAIPTDEEAFLHNGRIDDCGPIWFYQPDAVGFSVALVQPAWISHVVLYLNNAAPEDAYSVIAVLANDMELKVPVTRSLVRGNTRRFVVVHFDPPVHTDTLRILPGIHPKTQRETMTEIEVYGSLSEPSTNAVRGFPAGTNIWPMAMGGPAHVPAAPVPALRGAYRLAGERDTGSPAYLVGGITLADAVVFGDPSGSLRSAYSDPKRGVQFGRRWSLGSMTPLATPAWYADRLLVGCFDNRLYAVAASGAPLWNFKAEGRIYSSPTPDGDEVYFGSDDGRVYRVDLDSGVLLWEYEAGGQVRGATAVADGTVYAISGDGRLHAIDKERGKALWTAPLSPHTRTSPVVAGESAAGGASVLTLDEAGVARSHHAATGELRWEAGLGARSLLSPVVAGNLVLLPSDRGRIAARSLENGAPLWQRDLGLEISGQPFATETQLVVPTGDGVAVLRLADGGDDATVAGLEGIRDRIISVVPQGERLWVLLAAGVSKPYVGHTHFATHYGSVQLWEPVPEPAPQEGP